MQANLDATPLNLNAIPLDKGRFAIAKLAVFESRHDIEKLPLLPAHKVHLSGCTPGADIFPELLSGHSC
jgi:hypothetical protein